VISSFFCLKKARDPYFWRKIQGTFCREESSYCLLSIFYRDPNCAGLLEKLLCNTATTKAPTSHLHAPHSGARRPVNLLSCQIKVAFTYAMH
jgi:hypothetical protein